MVSERERARERERERERESCFLVPLHFPEEVNLSELPAMYYIEKF